MYIKNRALKHLETSLMTSTSSNYIVAVLIILVMSGLACVFLFVKIL